MTNFIGVKNEFQRYYSFLMLYRVIQDVWKKIWVDIVCVNEKKIW